MWSHAYSPKATTLLSTLDLARALKTTATREQQGNIDKANSAPRIVNTQMCVFPHYGTRQHNIVTM